MEQQEQWLGANKSHGYVKDMVYRSDIDHPMSMHNHLTNAQGKVEFPKTVNNLQTDAPQFTLNGYYDKDPASIKNKFKADPTAQV